ncbi:hypothetical protein FRC12_013973 [Ceratobasidium sp. 428]|nr:hypothetical protein FRC12_013973 [Ceratobasidium sp. 428]
MVPLRFPSLPIVHTLCFFVGSVLAQSPIRLDDSYVFGDSNLNGIQYSNSNWTDYNAGRSGLRYNGTYSASNKAGANVVLFFRGKSIKYYGDKDPNGGIATVRIDGQQYANVSVGAPSSGFSAQQTLWTSPALDSNDHQIVISNIGAKVNPKKGVMGLDFLEIVPNDGSDDIAPSNLGPGASNVPKNAILVDDTDSSITYAGNGWQPKSSTPDTTIYLRGSAHTTRFPGETCIFRFNGTAVWFFTDYSMGNAAVAISLDGGPPETVNTTAANRGLMRSQRMTWGKADLNNGPHTLMITHADWSGTWATIDFFKYIPSTNTAASSTGSSSSTASRSGSAAASTNLSASDSTSNSTLGGTIAGAVIGGVVGLILLALGILAMVRMRRKRDQSRNQTPNYVGSKTRLTGGMGDMSSNSLPTTGRPSALGHGSNEAYAPSSEAKHYPSKSLSRHGK